MYPLWDFGGFEEIHMYPLHVPFWEILAALKISSQNSTCTVVTCTRIFTYYMYAKNQSLRIYMYANFTCTLKENLKNSTCTPNTCTLLGFWRILTEMCYI